MFEHNFTVIKFPEDDEDNDNVELMRQLKKENGQWTIYYYGGLECEFCESHSYDRAQYKDEFDAMIKYVSLLDMKPHQKCYRIVNLSGINTGVAGLTRGTKLTTVCRS